MVCWIFIRHNVSEFQILRVRTQIVHSRSQTSRDTNFCQNRTIFRICVRHIGSAILNFENPISDSDSATSKTTIYQITVESMKYKHVFFSNAHICVMRQKWHDFFLRICASLTLKGLMVVHIFYHRSMTYRRIWSFTPIVKIGYNH